MMAITHAAIAVAGTSLILGTADPYQLGLAVLGSQLPDLDSTTSVVGQICYPVSSWIEDRYPHRTITHSLMASAILAAIAVSIGFYFFKNPLIAIAFPLWVTCSLASRTASPSKAYSCSILTLLGLYLFPTPGAD